MSKNSKGQELVLKASSVALPEIRKRRNKMITRKIAKKDKLSLKEHLFVYNTSYGLGAGVIGLAGLVPAQILLGGFMDVPLTIGLALDGAFSTFCGVVTGWRFTKQCESGNISQSHKQRYQNQFHEHNRKNAAHCEAREVRTKELDGKYDQFSVQIQYSPKTVMLSVLKHTPSYFGMYKGEVWSKDGRLAERQIDRETKEIDEETGRMKTISKDADTFHDELLQARSEMEEVAAETERLSYEKALEDLDTKRMALSLRRW